MQYLRFIKGFSIRNFRYFLYKYSSKILQNRLLYFFGEFKNIKKKKFINDTKKRDVDSDSFQFSWHSVALRSLRIRNINRKFSIFKSKRFKRVKLSLIRPTFVHLYNQKFLSKYSDLNYNWQLKHDIPFNIYYEHINLISRTDISGFLNKFVGMFTFSGKKQYALKLTILFRKFAKKANLNFYTLFRHFLFHYSPFVYLKVLVVKRRRITKPTLLSKEKAFFLLIKWWKEAAFLRKGGQSLAFNLFAELRDIFENKGFVVQKFRNLLVSAFNARSDLKRIAPRPYDRDKFYLWGGRYRRFLNRFVHNTIVSNKRWVRRLLRRRRVISSFVVRRFLLRSYRNRKRIYTNVIKSSLNRSSKVKSSGTKFALVSGNHDLTRKKSFNSKHLKNIKNFKEISKSSS